MGRLWFYEFNGRRTMGQNNKDVWCNRYWYWIRFQSHRVSSWCQGLTESTGFAQTKNSFRLKIFLLSLTCFIDQEVKCDFSFQKACKLTIMLTFSKIWSVLCRFSLEMVLKALAILKIWLHLFNSEPCSYKTIVNVLSVNKIVINEYFVNSGNFGMQVKENWVHLNASSNFFRNRLPFVCQRFEFIIRPGHIHRIMSRRCLQTFQVERPLSSFKLAKE